MDIKEYKQIREDQGRSIFIETFGRVPNRKELRAYLKSNKAFKGGIYGR